MSYKHVFKRASKAEKINNWEAYYRGCLSMRLDYLNDANDETLECSVREYAKKCAIKYEINAKNAVKKLKKLNIEVAA